jgi:protein TonB
MTIRRDSKTEVFDMIARYASSIATATVVTLGLFYVMHTLIALQPGAASEARVHALLRFIRIKPDETIIEIDPLDLEIPPPPNVPPRGEPDPWEEPGIRVATEQPSTPRQGFAPIGFQLSDAPLIIVMRVEPNYPPSLAQKGIEGYVVVRFDVMQDGGAENVSVVESSHRGFERNALSAAQRFRFKAHVVDGAPQVTTGVRYRFRFEMSD